MLPRVVKANTGAFLQNELARMKVRKRGLCGVAGRGQAVFGCCFVFFLQLGVCVSHWETWENVEKMCL